MTSIIVSMIRCLPTALMLAAMAESSPPTPPTPSCAKAEAPWRDFDFWVGEWEVTDPDSGQQFGTNLVERKEQGCLILEQWQSVDGGTGTSMNYYDPLLSRWRQVWQSAGVFIDYSGALDARGRMQLEGTIYYHGSGQQAPFRGRWTPNDDGSVLQEFWQYNETVNQWDVWFSGLYRRSGGH